MTDSTTKKVFAKQIVIDQFTNDFENFHAAEAHLKLCGFSVGRMQGPSPIGFMLGDWNIQKWRNLNEHERLQLDGVITGDMRTGPVVITLKSTAPQAAIDALKDFRVETCP